MLHRVVVLVLTSCVFSSGCANLMNQSVEHQELQRKEALTRWKGCLDRTQGLPSDMTLIKAQKMMAEHCEGHRRDVLLAFPATMEKELELVLRERSQRKVLQSTSSRLLKDHAIQAGQ